jgi:serine/threonine protein kinase
MKKTIFIMLLLMGAIDLKAQDYDPLVAEGKQWNVLLTYSPWPPINRVTDVYKIEGDTILEEATYKKLFTTQEEHYTVWELCGLLRETHEGQVFHRDYKWDHTFGSENMLYDFSMQPGDSICFYDSECLVLLSVSDTVLCEDCLPRKKYVFQYHAQGYPWDDTYETWIEGIGSEFGLLHPGSRFLVGGTYDLLCYYEDEDLIWQNSNFNSCYIGTTGLKENEKGSLVSVYPNPAKEKTVIEGTEVAEVQVYNAFGQLVKTVQGKNEINVSDLPDGIYLLHITDKESLLLSKRISVFR